MTISKKRLQTFPMQTPKIPLLTKNKSFCQDHCNFKHRPTSFYYLFGKLAALLIALLAFSACSPSRYKSTSEGLPSSIELPSGSLETTARSSEGFQFQSLLELEIEIQIGAFDLSRIDSSQDLDEDEVEQYRSSGPANAVLTLQKVGSKAPIHTAALNIHGYYKGQIMIPGHQRGNDYNLRIHKPDYHTRTILIRDLLQYSRIRFGTSIASTEHSVIIGQSTQTSAAVSGQQQDMSDQAPTPDTLDSDGDLIPNSYDAFPNDPHRAFRTVVPEDDFLTVAYEDNYPGTGDKDYNDFVARYQVIEVSNADNQIVELLGVVEPVVLIAAYNHRFGIYIRFPQGQATLRIENTDHNGNVIQTREKQVSNAADIVVYESTRDSISFVLPDSAPQAQKVHRYRHSYLTDPKFSEAQMRGHRAYFSIRFNVSIEADSMEEAPYDPYLIISPEMRYRGYDVHLAGKKALPSSRNPSYAPTGFRNRNGFPWALLVPTNWLPPKERQNIEIAYSNFTPWYQSRGETNSDWYLNPRAEYVSASTTQVAPEPDFPSVDPTNTNYLDGMNWNISAGAIIRDCKAPQVIDGDVGQVIDAEGWQDFIGCYFGSQTDSDLASRPSLIDNKAATGYVIAAHSNFSLSEAALGLTSLAKLERLYEAVTFRSISSADRNKLNKALENLSYGEVIDSFLSKWFNSLSYNTYYDYEANPYFGKSWFRITGTVRDHDANPTAGASISLRASGSDEALSQATSNSDGTYEILVQLANDISIKQTSLHLEASGYVTRDHAIALVAGETEYSQDFQTVSIDMAHPTQDGEIHSAGGGTAKAYIPAGAVDTQLSFSLTSPEQYVMTEANEQEDQEEVKALRFTASPDQEFTKPVMLEITLDTASKESLKVQEGDEDLALFVEQEDGSLRMLTPSIYNPQSGKLSAPTNHFSTFVITSCRFTFCPVSGTSRLIPSENASIFLEPRSVKFPEEIPALQTELSQKFSAAGWEDSTTIVENLNTEEVCPQGDTTTPCTEMVINLKDTTDGIPILQGYDFSEIFDIGDAISDSIGGLLGNIAGKVYNLIFSNKARTRVSGGEVRLLDSQIRVNSDLVFQTEQCAINPLSSDPQLRLNYIPAIRVSNTGLLRISSVTVEYPEKIQCPLSINVPDFSCSWRGCKVRYKRVIYGSYTCGVRQRTKHISSADIEVSIRGMRFSYSRGSENCSGIFDNAGTTWCLTQQSTGYVSIRSVRGGDGFRDYYDELKRNVMQRVEQDATEALRNDFLDEIRENFVLETSFDDTNCLVPTQTYSIGGTVSGLRTGESLILQNNGIDDLEITTNGNFTFPLALGDGANYAVSIKEGTLGQGRNCEVNQREACLVQGKVCLK